MVFCLVLVIYCSLFHTFSCQRLTISIRGKIFSRQQIEIFFFLIFPRQVLTFHANCLHNLHEMSNHVYSKKNEKNITNSTSAELAQSNRTLKYSLCINFVFFAQKVRGEDNHNSGSVNLLLISALKPMLW